MFDIPEQLSQTVKEGEILIGPSLITHNNWWKDWDHRWLRSMHIQESDGSIISVGLPKFVNLGTGCGKYHVTEDDILARAGTDLVATLKIDGSLLIRFVDDEGLVRWRTRGAFGVGLDNKWEIDQFCEENPKLADPEYYPEYSLLFEWVTPNNKIVIQYDEPQIILIGAVVFKQGVPWYDADPCLMEIKDLEKVASEMDVTLVDNYPLRTQDDVQNLLKDLESNKEIEGFVLRFDNDQQMTRVKAEQYTILHALRSNLTTEKLIELWNQWDRPHFTVYQEKFIEAYDEECWKWALPAASSMYDGVKAAKAIYAHVEKFVEDNRAKDRKTFALLAQDRFADLNLSLCFLLLDGKDVPMNLWKKMILRNCKHFSISMFKDE